MDDLFFSYTPKVWVCLGFLHVMLMLVGSCSPAVSFLWEVQCPALDTVLVMEAQPSVEGKAYFIQFAVFVPPDT